VPRLIESAHDATGVPSPAGVFEEADELGSDGVLVGEKALFCNLSISRMHGAAILSPRKAFLRDLRPIPAAPVTIITITDQADGSPRVFPRLGRWPGREHADAMR
jgi:hypothetical protein